MSIFNPNGGAVAFTPPPAGDNGPKLELTETQEIGGRKVYVGPAAKYQGKTLIIEIVGPVQFTDTDTGKEKTAVDAAKITVVETGEVFEKQRFFAAGIVRQIQGLAGQTIIARVGAYETEKRKGQKFVQLEAPSAEQVAKAQAVIAGSAPASSSDAPF